VVKLIEINNSRIEDNENNFDTLVNIYRLYHALMKLHGFGLNKNMIILYNSYNYGTSKRHLIKILIDF